MNTRRSRVPASALLAVIGLATACATPTPEVLDPVVGTYTAVTVNDVAIPGTITNNQGVRLEVLAGSFVIRADGTCTSRMVFVAPDGTEVVRDVDATYTVDDDTLTMHWEGAGVTTGTRDGDTFTMNNVGMILVYRKDVGASGLPD